MLIEVDVDELELEVSMCFELTITDEQIECFNKKKTGFLIKRGGKGKFTNEPHLLLWQIFPEEDESENLGPFTTIRSALQAVLVLSHLSTGITRLPVIHCMSAGSKTTTTIAF